MTWREEAVEALMPILHKTFCSWADCAATEGDIAAYRLAINGPVRLPHEPRPETLGDNGV